MKIKFATLNIWDGGRLFDNIVAFIKKENPDIIVLQEVYDGKDCMLEKRFRTIEIFKRELGFPYSVFSPVLRDVEHARNIEQGNAIFSRFPIIDQNTTFFDVSYGKFNFSVNDSRLVPSILQHVVVLLNNVRLNIFNIHGIWDFDGQDNKRRLKMSETVINKIRGKENVILAGDFNVEPNTKTIKNIERHLDNVFKDELITTFNMRRKIKGGYAKSVVDMVFVSKNIKVIDHYCPQVDISDHLPLVYTLEL